MKPSSTPRTMTTSAFVPDMQGDNIYNGAADNATGCGILLELARAYSAPLNNRPPASIFRRRYCGRTGPARLGISRPAPARSRRARSPSTSTYDMASCPSASRIPSTSPEPNAPTSIPQYRPRQRLRPRRFSPTPTPAGHYYRSDHFSLARVGIPVLLHRCRHSLRMAPDEWGNQRRRYVENHYHQPTDEFQATLGLPRTGRASRASVSISAGKPPTRTILSNGSRATNSKPSEKPASPQSHLNSWFL